MKTAIVISDTHGNRAKIDELFPLFEESDYIFHLGDTSSDGNYIRARFPDKTFILNGNCDAARLGENELCTEIEGVKIFACHGDKFGVKSGGAKLSAKAKELNCTVALYGHTHCAVEKVIDEITQFNPGTLSRYSRQSYLYLVLNDGNFTGKIVYLNG